MVFDPNPVAVQARPMDPTKDLAAYGYGSVAWKERVDSWKLRQEKMQMMMSDGGQLHSKGGDMDGDANGPDLPMYAFFALGSSRITTTNLCNEYISLVKFFRLW
jgi:hypothetical protein